MPLTPFTKPWCTKANLVTLLAERGLSIPDQSAAERFLAHVNYYRFSGYCLAFEVPGQRHTFDPGTTFEQLRSAYDFDFALRDLVSEALEVIEVDLRTAVATLFGQKYGAFGHTDPANFYRPPPARGRNPRPPFNHAGWLTRVREEVERSGERFVEHFRRTYSETAHHDLPVWVLSEVMSFGCVSRMISGMESADQKVIAARYRLQNLVLVSWVHHLVVARNVCAHHGRLWDRFWGVPPLLPAGHAWQPPHLRGNRRLAVTVLILYHMLKNIADCSAWAVHWQLRLRAVLTDLPNSPATPSLGFAQEWFANPIWAAPLVI